MTGDIFGCIEIDITDGFFRAVGEGDSVDADVDHDRAVFEELGANQLRFTDGHHNDVGAAGVLGNVARFDMAQRDGGHLLSEQQGDGFTCDFAGADDDGFGAGQG